MSLDIPFDNSYARLPERFYTALDPTPVADPGLIAFNHDLAATLGFDSRAVPDATLAALFSGNEVPGGALPLAQVYAGHQFGQWNPQLGDGRAILLGEVVGTDGTRRDIQLKGSGRTPYSRMGDGRAWLGPVLREYVMSEAMHALGIPTTRALAAVTTGERVLRETVLPGAVFTRVAQSHIRVGTFQFFASRGDIEGLKALTAHTIARHYPEAAGPRDLIEGMMARQARLIALWMSVGFIHGVMNTDNCQIAGETIDYGPCAFMDRYHPETVFSSIDQFGRYAYVNQPQIAHWNIAQFASALIPMMEDADAAVAAFTEAINGFPALYEAEWLRAFAAKLGIAEPLEGDRALIEDLLSHMAETGADFTNTFADLEAADLPDGWHTRWQVRAPDPALMARTNPRVIPRLHRIEQAITAGVAGDLAPFHELLRVTARPFDLAEADRAYTAPPKPEERVERTFCGT